MNYRLSREELKTLLLEIYHLGASSPFDLAESIVESVIEDKLATKVDKHIAPFSYVTATGSDPRPASGNYGVSSTYEGSVFSNNIIVDFDNFNNVIE